jgi:sarcosine oxidase gamma subunit
MTDGTISSALLLTADMLRHPWLGDALAGMLGAPLPAPGIVAGSIIGQGPKDWLILCSEPTNLAPRLEAAGPVIATPAGLIEFRLTADQLASGTAVRPAPGHCAVTRFAQLRVTIVAEAEDFRLFVEAPVARHVAVWLTRQQMLERAEEQQRMGEA